MTVQLGELRVRGWVKAEVPIRFAEGEQPVVEDLNGRPFVPDNLQFEVSQRADGKWSIGVVGLFGYYRRENGTVSDMRLGRSWAGPNHVKFKGPQWAADAVRAALADGIVMGKGV